MKLLRGKKTLFELSLMVFVFTLPTWTKLNTLAVYPIIASWLLMNNWSEKIKLIKQNATTFTLMTALFLLYFYNLLFFENSKHAWELIIRVSPIFIFPLIIFSTPKKYYRLINVYSSFIGGIIFTILVCWGRIILDIFSKQSPMDQAGYFFNWIYTDFNLVKPFNSHPSYVGVLTVLAIIILMSYPGFERFRNKRSFLYRGILIAQSFFILQTNSRVSLVCLFLFFTYHFISRFNRKSIIQYLALVGVLAISVLKFDYLYNKMTSVLSLDGGIILDRYPRWLAILGENKIWGNKWLGSGVEKAQFIYDEAYFKGGFDLALTQHYNSHNQYLDYFVFFGFMGLIIFVVVLAHFFIRIRKDFIPLSFIMIFSLFAMSESYLWRSAGCLIFGFLYPFFLFNSNENR